jgi:DNA modification methylase
VLKDDGSFIFNIKENVINGERSFYVFDTLKKIHDQGFKWNETYMWCLASGTKLFVNISGKYELLTIKDLYDRKEEKILVPTQDAYGKNIWIRVKNVFDNGKSETIKITTHSGCDVICTPNHKLVYRNSNVKLIKKQSNFRRPGIIEARKLDKNNFLYTNVNMSIDLPDGDDKDYDDGYFIGFYIAEGSKRKRNGNDAGIQLACGIKDIERGYVAKLKRWKLNQYIYPNRPNQVNLRCNGTDVTDFINEYIDGEVCDAKHLKTVAFNRSKKFLLGILEGFLDGDGSHDKENNRWRIGIKPNEELKDQLQLICRILGFDFRYSGTRSVKCKDKNYFVMDMSIKKGHFRIVNYGCIVERIRSISYQGMENVYDLEVEQLYDDNPKGRKNGNRNEPEYMNNYNNLYFLANGIWTHNSKPNPYPVKPVRRMKDGFEYMFHLVKSDTFKFHPERVMKKPARKNYCESLKAGKRLHEVQYDNGLHPINYGSFLKNCDKSYPSNVLTFGAARKTRHPAQFPPMLPEFFIKAMSDPGDVVLDPFAGSGTTVAVAKKSCRDGIGFELKKEYVDAANVDLRAISCQPE